MKLKEIVLTWDAGGDVVVARRTMNDPLLGRWVYYSGYSDSDGLLVLLSDFVALTVRDHCDPFKVYKAMAEIDEFISYMAVDV